MNSQRIGWALGAVALMATVTACGSGSGDETAASASPTGTASVVIDGQQLAGDAGEKVSCTKSAEKVTIGSGADELDKPGVGAVLSTANPPNVESVGIYHSGTFLIAGESGGKKVGEATATVDDDLYTVTGTVVGVDVRHPTTKQEKKFEIVVMCSAIP